MRQSKRFRANAAKIDRARTYELEEAVSLVKELAPVRFDETVDLALKLNVKARQAVRDTMVLPHAFTAEKKILVFARGDKAEEARAAGATYVGDTDLITRIKQEGWVDFEVAIATPDMMREVGTLGPVLGRRGLMPNPKSQTVTNDVRAAIAELRRGRVEFRADRGGVIHMSVGKLSMASDQLVANARAVVHEVARRKPADVKGDFIRGASICSTMGPGVRISAKES
jgi:large subunit ribosomal protein L1